MTDEIRGVAMVLVLIPAAASQAVADQARESGGIGISVFEDRNYRGGNATFTSDTASLGSLAGGREPAHLRRGLADLRSGFQGQCLVVSSDQPDLGSAGWRNRIRSIRRVQ